MPTLAPPLENPRTMALNVARPMQALRVLLLWPTRTLNAIGAWLLRAVGVPPGGRLSTDSVLPFFVHRGCTSTTVPSVRVMLKSTISTQALVHLHFSAATVMW